MAEYVAMGDTITRFFKVMLRACKGKNMGGVDLARELSSKLTNDAMKRSYDSTNLASRSRKFSCEMRWLRVSNE